MHRLLPSLGLAVFLALSLGLKAAVNSTAGEAGPQSDGADVVAFMRAHGFSVAASDPNNPIWISASAGNCSIQVADVSPQGWQQALVTEQAAGQHLAYVYAGKVYDDQPILLTTLDHYWQRLMRYLHLPSSSVPIRAVVLSPECPAALQQEDIASLSR